MFLWPSLIAAGCLDGLYFSVCSSMSMGSGQSTQNPVEVAKLLLLSIGLPLLIAIIASVVGWEATLRSAALTRLTLLQDTDYADAYAASKKRTWRISMAGFVQLFLPTVLMIPLTLSGAVLITFLSRSGAVTQFLLPIVGSLGLLLLTIAFLWCFAYTIMIFPVVCCDDLSAYRSLTRTLRLTTRYFWRSAVFAVLLLICLAAICAAAFAPFTVAVVVDIRNHNSPMMYQLPIYLHIYAVIMVAFASLLSLAIVPIGGALCYYDLIMRHEGQDMLERVENFSRKNALTNR